MSIICNNCNISNKDEALYCNKCGIRLSEITLTEGKILDKRYEILELIKTGGMGAVYKARDERLTQICAVKELLSSSIDDGEYAVKRFHEEAKILASLRHSNLPRVIDHFTEHGKYYLVMDFIDGQDLETILKSNKDGLNEDKVIEYTKQLLDVLIYLHSQNPPVVYRDLKPSNIMVQTSDGRIILIDFGIARTVRPGSLTQKTGIGTEGYIAPEQYTGKPEPASDIYSLGATIHHLVTGQKPLIPFNFRPVKELKPGITEEFHNIIMKSLQMKPEARFTAQEMKKAIYELKKLPEIYKQKKVSSEKTKTETCKGFFSYFSLTKKVSSPSDEPDRIILHPADNSSMILIRKGYFFMGDNNSEANEYPEHKIFLDDYYIDKYPVTNIQYDTFIKNTSYESQGTWQKYYSERTEHHPVTNISWQDAKSYADWAGKRLPTEAEWEKAARGTDRRKYPWGNKWDKNLCNNRDLDIRELIDNMSDIVNGRGTLRAGSFPGGASPYGVMDMAGQVIEWCSDWYDPHYYQYNIKENPAGPKSGREKVMRGGCWYSSNSMFCNCTHRDFFPPYDAHWFYGFRCAKGIS
ncbi:MAG: bifunctional serine/threonine-protein kinase/formylglycine-generating enzyme family protein [Candidatus Eremiobacterota bacterium]